MRTESNLQPGVPFEINELPDGMAEVLFYENVEEIPDEEVERFKYDLYYMIVPNRDTLEADIETNYNQWISCARAVEDAQEPVNPIDEVRGIAEDAKTTAQDTADILNEFMNGLAGE